MKARFTDPILIMTRAGLSEAYFETACQYLTRYTTVSHLEGITLLECSSSRKGGHFDSATLRNNSC